ncbi:MAG: AbrB/MazE/SpoVT family DNA-binding domain-containing protein [Armatimonadota bacterium]
MAIVRVDKNGRITIPVAFRKQVGIGDQCILKIDVEDDEIHIRKSVLNSSGIFAEAAKGKPTDWETIREEAERAFALDYVTKMQEPDDDHKDQ